MKNATPATATTNPAAASHFVLPLAFAVFDTAGAAAVGVGCCGVTGCSAGPPPIMRLVAWPSAGVNTVGSLADEIAPGFVPGASTVMFEAVI